MKWRTARHTFVGLAGNGGLSRQGQEKCACRCGRTIEASAVFRSDTPHRARAGSGPRHGRNISMATKQASTDQNVRRSSTAGECRRNRLSPLPSPSSIKAELQIPSRANSFDHDPSSEETYAKQTRPFIVEIKRSRKPQNKAQKASIWGKMDLRVTDEPIAANSAEQGPSAATDVVAQRQSERPSVA